MSHTVESVDDWSLWDRFAGASPQGSIFCQTAYLDATGRKYAGLWIRPDGQPLIGCLVMMEDDGQPLASPQVFSLYQGVLLAPAILQQPPHRRIKLGLELVEALLEEIERRWKRVTLCLHHRLDDLRGFQWFNYHAPEKGRFALQLGYTGLVDFGGAAAFDDYLATVREVKRQEYRKGARLGHTVGGLPDIDTLADLHRLTFERQGIAYDAQQESLLRSIAHAAIEQGFGELLLCHAENGVPAAATLFLRDATTAYYLFGANHPDHRKTGAGTYLTLESMRRAFERGIRCIDMVGINSPNRGDYKTSLNARPAPYFNATWAKPASLA
jgi:GNAT superfamily N-acetyltransferase